MKKVNTLVLCRDDYNSHEEWQMEIGKAMLMLANAQYIMVAKLDETGIFCIEYEYDHEDWGCDYPYWLSPDEYESVVWDDEREKDEDSDDMIN